MQLYKTILKTFTFLLLTLFTIPNSSGQNCIDYPDIIGDACKNCAPPGWIETNLFLIYAHIMVPVDGPLPETSCILSDVSGYSPSGGNVVALFGTWDWDDLTTIQTTVSGLTPGEPYTFGMYWEEITATCAINTYVEGGIMQITINGELYEFSGATEWELAEVCFTPTSGSAEVKISVTPPTSPGDAAIIIDGNFDCSLASPCCTLSPSVGNESYTTCPAETIILEGEYEGAMGSVQVEWTCDPPEGLTYLSTTNEITPTFSYPAVSSDFEGETFKYTLSVQDDVCTELVECVEVVVQASIAPTFDLELCDLDGEAELPIESENGYTGTWEGDFNISASGGNFVSFTFVVDDGQNNCIGSYEYEFFVNEGYTPTFIIDNEYCVSDDSYYLLPAVSVEFIEGDWIPINEFNPSQLGLGTYTFTFVPDEIYCVTDYELTFSVVLGESPSFNLPAQFCSESSYYVLPQESLEGVSGSWSIDSIDLSIPIQDAEVVFTPDENENCFGAYNYSYVINQDIEPLFDLPESICREDIVISFDPVSSQNIAGTWTPSQFNPDTASTFIVATWIPENQDSCILPLEVNIPIIDPQALELDLPDTLCVGDMTYDLPDVDDVEGSWNIVTIELENYVDASITVVYEVAEDECYFDFSHTIFVTGLEVLQFSIVNTYCSGDASFMLPETSNDEVEGNWNVDMVDPSMQDSLVIVFTPNGGDCYDMYGQTLYFTPLVEPSFDIPTMICEDDAPFTFPNVSDNGVNGTWAESTLDPSMTTENTFSNTFTPDEEECSSASSITIEILSFENVLVEVTHPTSCESEDGYIQILGSDSGMQLSTNEGMTWTAVMDIDNLVSGSYTIQVRYEDLPSCSVVFTPQLNSSESPVIQELIATHPSACDQEDGSIVCVVDGDNLEYSIDEVSWQASNVFENLGEGTYVIYVRVTGQMDCVSSASTALENPSTEEICDGIDNNCNGEIDEDLPTANYYADKDMDGFGDPDDLISDCSQPQGYILDNTDCDDEDADIYPGADEIPNNGIDEDCDGADLTTSTHELMGQEIDIYPNPTSGYITIEMEEGSHVTVSLYDLNGRCLMYDRQLNTLDLSEYSNGIYLLKITDQKSLESIVERVVVYR